jgi:hypothetical protein
VQPHADTAHSAALALPHRLSHNTSDSIVCAPSETALKQKWPIVVVVSVWWLGRDPSLSERTTRARAGPTFRRLGLARLVIKTDIHLAGGSRSVLTSPDSAQHQQLDTQPDIIGVFPNSNLPRSAHAPAIYRLHTHAADTTDEPRKTRRERR